MNRRCLIRPGRAANPPKLGYSDPTVLHLAWRAADTTYNLDTGTMLVLNATDPDGDQQQATYNPQNNTTLTQTAAGGQLSYTYGANARG